MKPLSTFTFAAVLSTIAPAISATAAINCGSLPSCADLGYTDTVTNCASGALKCPFDTTKGKCVNGPRIGDLKYSLSPQDHDGWLLCDGRQFSADSTAKYYELFKIIRTNFCHKYTSKWDDKYDANNCQPGMFAIPDYRGFFLRAASYKVTATSAVPTVSSGTSGETTVGTAFEYKGGGAYGSVVIPHPEQLPNIKGELFAGGIISTFNWNNTIGAFAGSTVNNIRFNKMGAHHATQDNDQIQQLIFDASHTDGTGKGIYMDDAHVLPANYSAYLFIYAGR